MAKARGKTKKRDKEVEDIDSDAAAEDAGESAGAEKNDESTSKARSIIDQIGDGLRAAGEAAGRYTKLGVAMAELEKVKLDLRSAYAKLGEGVVRCWDAAPDIAVSANDSDVKEHLKKVSSLRRHIRELEARIHELKQAGA